MAMPERPPSSKEQQPPIVLEDLIRRCLEDLDHLSREAAALSERADFVRAKVASQLSAIELSNDPEFLAYVRAEVAELESSSGPDDLVDRDEFVRRYFGGSGASAVHVVDPEDPNRV